MKKPGAHGMFRVIVVNPLSYRQMIGSGFPSGSPLTVPHVFGLPLLARMTPAACGADIDVPLTLEYPPLRQVEQTLTPGAQ